MSFIIYVDDPSNPISIYDNIVSFTFVGLDKLYLHCNDCSMDDIVINLGLYDSSYTFSFFDNFGSLVFKYIPRRSRG